MCPAIVTTDRSSETESFDSTPTGLFEGVETAFGQRRTNAAVQGTPKQTHSVKEFGYSLEKHQSEVIRSLGIEAEFSYSFLAGGDVSTRVKFFNDLDLTEESVVILMSFLNTVEYAATDVAFRSKVTLPASSSENKAFYDSYGDSFVSRVQTGGAFYAAFVFHSSSKTEQLKIVAELEADGISGGAIDASMVAKLNEFQKKSSVTTTFRSIVLGYDVMPPSKIEDIYTFYESLSGDTPGDYIVSYETTSYTHVPNFVPNDKWEILETNISEVLNVVGPALARNTELKTTVATFKDTIKFWDSSRTTAIIKELSDKESEYKTNIATGTALLSSFQKSPFTNLTINITEPTERPSIDIDFNYTMLGGPGGGLAYPDAGQNDSLVACCRSIFFNKWKMEKVDASWGLVCNNLQTYLVRTGPNGTIHGLEVTSGNTSGGNNKTTYLPEYQTIKTISVLTSNWPGYTVLWGIKIETTEGTSVEIAQPVTTASASVKIGDNEFYLGFVVFGGYYVDSIYVLRGKINGINWHNIDN